MSTSIQKMIQIVEPNNLFLGCCGQSVRSLPLALAELQIDGGALIGYFLCNTRNGNLTWPKRKILIV